MELDMAEEVVDGRRPFVAMAWAIAMASVAALAFLLVGARPSAAAPVCTNFPGPNVTLVDCLDITPAAATNPLGTPHTVSFIETASFTPPAPLIISPQDVVFTVVSGPNAGFTTTIPATAVTVSCPFACTLTGSATYVGSGGAGTDTVQFCGAGPGSLCTPTATKTWVCAAGQTQSGTTCVNPPATPAPQFASIAVALGGQGGYTEPCDPGTCPTGAAAAAQPDGPSAPAEDLTPPRSSANLDDAGSDDPAEQVLDALLA